jgi:hypothetical protein
MQALESKFDVRVGRINEDETILKIYNIDGARFLRNGNDALQIIDGCQRVRSDMKT